MRKDVIVDRYARLYELPHALASAGHDVIGICLDYRRRRTPYESEHPAPPGRLRWHSHALDPFVLPALFAYRQRVLQIIDTFRPHVLLGGSDALHVIFARAFAARSRVPYVVDLYDNYASFGLARIPGVKAAYHRALRDAHAVTCVSNPLRELIERTCRPHGPTITLESTVDSTRFRALDRLQSRRHLGLPEHKRLVGTAGALDASRGTSTLFDAYRRLRADRTDVALVLAGDVRHAAAIRSAPDVYLLGELPHETIPELFNALDVAVVCMRDSAFGRYAFPQKLYEIIACGVPLVAARVGAIAAALAAHPQVLYTPGDPADLHARLQDQLRMPLRINLVPPSWIDQAHRLETLLRAAADTSWTTCREQSPQRRPTGTGHRTG